MELKNLYIYIYRVLVVVCLLLLAPAVISAQSTKIKGRVTDKDTGEGIPFVGMYFKGTHIGATTDMDGYYTIEARDLETDILTAFLLGYETAEAPVRLNSFNHIDFELMQSSDLLDASLVKPDNRYMKWLLKQIDKNRDRNNPEKRNTYECNVYNKMEMDLSNPEKNLKSRYFKKKFGFVFDYIDTSVVSGRPYLPVMISESVTKRYHALDPSLDKEIIQASQISGLNPDNALAHFTGSMHLKTNFYENFISAFNLEIPSPISGSGDLYYNYYLIDSLQIDNRKTYKIRFHPKKFISTPSFDGEMSIDAQDFALRDIHVKLQKEGNVNWIKDLVIDVENEKVGDSVWFYKNDKLYADMAVALSDSSNFISMIGHRDMLYYDPVFDKEPDERIVKQGYTEVLDKGANRRDDAYWAEVRPYQLSEKEQDVYTMVDRVKKVPVYNTIYTLVNSLICGYWEVGKLSFGTFDRLTSFNNLEGRRFQMGIRTTRELSRKFRFTGYAAYALGDHRWKGGADMQFIFNNNPTRMLTVKGRVDNTQLGKGSKAFSETNMLSNVMSKGGGGYVKKSRVDEFSVKYEHEFNSNFSNLISLESRRIHSNNFVPMVRPDGTVLPNVASNYLRNTMRFSWEEAVTRGAYEKQYLYTDYPVITIDLMGGVKGLWKHDYNFLRTEFALNYNLKIPPVGISRIQLNAGKIFGKVPYPMLKLHEGNATYFLDKSAFSCMDYYEFASDAWVSCFFEHNFEGFILGKIPLIRKLNLREVFNVKAVYGTISDKNNGVVGSRQSRNAELLFPEGMKELKTPYVEMGFGITNILRLFRVDFNWRLTHRYHEVNGVKEQVPHRMSINVGLDISF